MKHILRQAALTFVSFAFLYATLGALSFLMFPDSASEGQRDFQNAEQTLYMTVPKYVFLGRSVLNSPAEKAILVGASNTGVGFIQKTIQSKLACAKVSNLAVGGANISEAKQIIDMVHEVQSQADRPSNTFVIGVWFGMFVDSDVKYADPDRNRGETDIDLEKYRYGFYRRTLEGPAALLPASWLDAGVLAIRPILVIEKMAREARAGVNLLLTGRKSAQRNEAEREAAGMSEQDKKKALDYWNEAMGKRNEISLGQVEVLKNTIETLLRSGERVVLIDLPIPAWHRDASPFQRSYEQAFTDVSRQFDGQRSFVSMSMSDLSKEQDYSDEVHAKRHLADVWSDRLANVLNPFVCRTSPEQARVSLRGSDQFKAETHQ
ncbi:hypothetical protein [Bradyrhizobium iriomotense]|uniref:SGNH/GDSL hydrolase family protein n=1 Tax=Bradyrhizobium iriomotense TaxID=441950 RepID=A0ABQ6BB24_9BRAD|nr:hypothetical protein [Bradyrhizobium iriomotense]GLR91031.1 hypothetical protein GCM10007857_77470 [Bradyrhizobium iriomotense]